MRPSAKAGPPPLRVLSRMRDLVPIDERPDEQDRKRLAVTAMIDAIGREQRARVHQRRWETVLAAAGVVLVLGGLLRFARPQGGERTSATGTPSQAHGGEVRVGAGTVAVVHGTATRAISAGSARRVEAGDEVQGHSDSAATLALPRGVQVALGAATDVWLTLASETEQRLRLDNGKTDVSVPRPGGPRVFSIRTPDSEVIVHGTIFSVTVEREPPSFEAVTSVSVTRGSVLVVHAGERRLLEANESWSSRRQVIASVGSASDEPSRSASRVRPERELRVSPPARPRTALTEQNRLFQASLDARDAHDDERAVRYLDELLARFPESPLCDQARILRARAVERLDLARGRH